MNGEAFADWLREARRAKGLTQRGLALMLDVLPNTVSRWETGQQEPPAPRRRAIERLLRGDGRGIESVAEEPRPYGAEERTMLERVTPDEVRILGIYRWLVSQSEGGKR